MYSHICIKLALVIKDDRHVLYLKDVFVCYVLFRTFAARGAKSFEKRSPYKL